MVDSISYGIEYMVYGIYSIHCMVDGIWYTICSIWYVNMRILQTMVSRVSPVLGLRARV